MGLMQALFFILVGAGPPWVYWGSTMFPTTPGTTVPCPCGASPHLILCFQLSVLTQSFPPLHHQLRPSPCCHFYWHFPAPASTAKNNPLLWWGALAAPVMRRSRSGRRATSGKLAAWQRNCLMNISRCCEGGSWGSPAETGSTARGAGGTAGTAMGSLSEGCGRLCWD